MNKYESVVLILDEMVAPLNMAGIQDWAEGLRQISEYKESEASILYSEVLRMYGGSGSLNDLVLYRNEELLMHENNKLDELRSELYQLCR